MSNSRTENTKKASVFGFTLQAYICKYYGLEIPDRLEKYIDLNEMNINRMYYESLRQTIFSSITLKPKKCVTFELQPGERTQQIPYNFILENGKTLSVRTTTTSGKISPRIVGQAGLSTLSKYFADVFGRDLMNQDDMKELICNHIEQVLPVFVENIFTSDYLAYVDLKKRNITILNGLIPDIDYDKKHFTFTRMPDEWKWSTILKYKGIQLAEVQAPKGRSIIFRFFVEQLRDLLVIQKENNETLGMSAEEAVCQLFGLDDCGIFLRSNQAIVERLKPHLTKVFSSLPKPIKYTGRDEGNHGRGSKCPYDFVLEGGLTLSLKTNYGKMVCPPDVGQPNSKNFSVFFKDVLNNQPVSEELFKETVYGNTSLMIKRYLEHLFDSDYLVRLKDTEGGVLTSVFPKNYGNVLPLDESFFSFSRKTKEEWNESNVVYYNKKRFGEFQYHHNRDCLKFRFDFDNLVSLINDAYKKAES